MSYKCWCVSGAVATAAIAFILAGPSTGLAQETAAGCPAEPQAFHKCGLEKARTFNPPRLPDGTPDFRGFWDSLTNGAPWDFEPRKGEPPLAPPSTGLRVDGTDRKIPYQPRALAERNAVASKKFDDGAVHCARMTIPRTSITYGNRPFQITQPPGYVVFLYENYHDYSIVPLDRRPHLPESIKLWHPHGVGRWEGNTLVVDYANFNGKQWMDQSGNFQTEHTHIVERYTMVDRDTIHFEATIDDPTIYTQPWTIAFALIRNKEEGHYILEYACHEGERDLEHYTEEHGKGQSDKFTEPITKE